MLAIDTLEISGADPVALAAVRATGIDHGGNPVTTFVDDEGGWPLRCCLRDSAPGDLLAIIAWSPFPWRGPFAEVGPVVVHGVDCGGRTDDEVPAQLLARPQIVRPYGYDRRIAYDHVRLVEGDGSLPEVLRDVLARDEVDFVLVRNLLAGCYSFTARRGGVAPR